MKKSQLYILAIISGVLLSIAWPERGFPFLSFFAFIPLLWIDYEVNNNQSYFGKFSFLNYAFVAMFIWNIITCWWIIHASLFGTVAAILINSMFMALVWHLFHITKKNIYRDKQNLSVLIFFWIAFEYFHQNWELAWPWLTLGNVFASYPAWIQWYEFTGSLGGSFWILAINIGMFFLLKNILLQPKNKRKISIVTISTILIFLIPSIFSLSMYYQKEKKELKRNVVLVQPNINPFTEKYNKLQPIQQLKIMLSLAVEKVNNETDLLVFPETALVDSIFLDNIEGNVLIKTIRNFIQTYPKLVLVTGASVFKIYNKEHPTFTAKKSLINSKWYDIFNSAFFIENNTEIQKYYKYQLVPGVEKIPFHRITNIFNKLVINLGGNEGVLATQKGQIIFKSKQNNLKIAPVICYESVFGEYVANFISQGANIIVIISNDGWWRTSPGYRQHLQYSRIRAIETRRNIVRCANTGISCFINSKGEIIEQSKINQKIAMRNNIYLNEKITFYVKNGNYIGRIFSFFCALLLLYAASISVIKKGKKYRKL